MTKSPRKNVPDVGIEFGATFMPSGHASDQTTVPGSGKFDSYLVAHLWRQVFSWRDSFILVCMIVLLGPWEILYIISAVS